jgi:flagellin-specific chaperone FliS
MGGLKEKVVGKIAKKVMDMVSDNITEEMLQPLHDIIPKLLMLLDIDNQPEIKVKLLTVRGYDYETYQLEDYTCIGFRIVEPVSLEDRIERLQQILQKRQKKT